MLLPDQNLIDTKIHSPGAGAQAECFLTECSHAGHCVGAGLEVLNLNFSGPQCMLPQGARSDRGHEQVQNQHTAHVPAISFAQPSQAHSNAHGPPSLAKKAERKRLQVSRQLCAAGGSQGA